MLNKETCMLQIIDPALERIRAWLHALRYDDTQRQRRADYYVTPFPAYKQWKNVTAQLDTTLRLAYDLLLFGEPVAVDAAEQAWGQQVVEDLLTTQIVHLNECMVRSRYSLVSYDGRYLVVSLHASYPAARAHDGAVYIGPDSYGLLAGLPRQGRYGRVLEVCAGSALCSLVLADRASHVVGTDLNAEAVAVAQFNAALNGVAERVDMRSGSLYEPVADEQFDLIVANPPFLPVPAQVAHPLAMCGNGGADGFSVLGELLADLPAHLAPGGTALIYAEGLGVHHEGRDHAFIGERLRLLAEATGLDVTLRLIGRMPIKQVLRLKAITLANQGDGPLAELPRWCELYESFGATHSYNFVIELRHGQGQVVHGIERRRRGAEPHFAVGKGTFVTT
jgi:hypothetical protein